jgi:hypothetical protein
MRVLSGVFVAAIFALLRGELIAEIHQRNLFDQWFQSCNNSLLLKFFYQAVHEEPCASEGK